ncbi:MAG: tRNA (N(6)-L-threonylcarbamoyladenosine(37)-C(2))-methylthiotransferase MtaB, partial [Verrucomicrobia bacterium]|nr:tRNA (N(6)-L-threonylcarbamoyladenosine(37)-C(2))-methylthiotransferase MtaB [Verrucomicrobiota bacterium]
RLLDQNRDFTFTTDVIVGFPGETEADFVQTLEVMREICFAKVHMFPYSDRPRTRSALYTDKVPPQVMSERKARALQVAEETAYQLRQRFIGRTAQILTEGQDEHDGQYIVGHTANFLSVMIPKGEITSNQLIEVQLLSNSPKGLVGQKR